MVWNGSPAVSPAGSIGIAAIVIRGDDSSERVSTWQQNYRRKCSALDTRGDRTFVDSYNASLGLVVSDEYDPNADNNLYDEINGLSYSFDDNQNETYDPTTGLYKAYDYLGRLVAEDRDSALTEPEKRYRYDACLRQCRSKIAPLRKTTAA